MVSIGKTFKKINGKVIEDKTYEAKYDPKNKGEYIEYNKGKKVNKKHFKKYDALTNQLSKTSLHNDNLNGFLTNIVKDKKTNIFDIMNDFIKDIDKMKFIKMKKYTKDKKEKKHFTKKLPKFKITRKKYKKPKKY